MSLIHLDIVPFAVDAGCAMSRYGMIYCQQVAIVQYRDSEHALGEGI